MASYVTIFSQPPSSDYTLVYSDEFNGSSISPEWNIEPYKQAGGIPKDCIPTGHGYYTHPSNCSVNNGLLSIKGRRLSHFIYLNPTGIKYEAGGISTGWLPKFGYFEIKCKMPSKKGFYPAFWFYNFGSTNWQEIDVFEYCVGKSYYYPSTHYEIDNDNIHDTHHGANSTDIQIPDLSQDFHTFAVEWTTNWTHYYFDGNLKASFPTLNNKDPMIMIISLGVDVCFGGCELDFNSVSSDGLEDSQQFKVDYIRYYKKENIIEALHKNSSFCINTTENRVSVTNIPNVTYDWDIPSQIQVLEDIPWDGSNSAARSKRISCSQPGNYTIKVTTTFPSGYSQTLWFSIIFTWPEQPCSIGGTFNYSSNLNYVNFTNNYYNTVSLNCPNVDHYQVTRTNGSYIYINCNGTCSFFSLDMNNGQSLTVEIKAFDKCNNLIGSRNAVFVRQQSYYGFNNGEVENEDLANLDDEKILPVKKNEVSINKNNFTIFPNPSQSIINVSYPKSQVTEIGINDILGKRVKTIKLKSDELGYQSIDISDFYNGVFIVSFYGNSNEILFRDKLYVSK